MLKFEQVENCKHSIKILLRRKNIWFLRRTNHYTNTLANIYGLRFFVKVL